MIYMMSIIYALFWQTVLNRYNSFTGIHYKDDPTIMAWELMNEPRCTSDPSGRTIQVSLPPLFSLCLLCFFPILDLTCAYTVLIY